VASKEGSPKTRRKSPFFLHPAVQLGTSSYATGKVFTGNLERQAIYDTP